MNEKSDSPGVHSDSGTKRGSDTNEDFEDDRNRKKSRFEGERAEVRLIIPSWISGSIIGKGGDNIKRLRSNYQAGITLPDSRGPERLVVITSEIEKICDALEDIIPTLTRQQQNKNQGDDEHELRMLVHQGHAGKIIGKSGNTIKDLREETGTHVKIYVTPCPKSTDRVVQMSGSARQISNCVHNIYKIIDGATPKGAIIPYNPDNYDITMANKYGGFDEERGGGSGKGKVRGGRDSSPRGGSRGDYGRGPRMPTYDDRYDSRGVLGRSGEHRRSSGGSSGSGMAALNPSNERETSQVSIPKCLAGAILGKGGQRIKQVQHESGTKIKMDDATVDSDDRIITIIGTKEQIQYAQYLLQMMVKKFANSEFRQ